MNPLVPIIESFKYAAWSELNKQKIKEQVLALNIPGIKDVSITETGDTITVTPLFATEEDAMWFVLKYVNTL